MPTSLPPFAGPPLPPVTLRVAVQIGPCRTEIERQKVGIRLAADGIATLLVIFIGAAVYVRRADLIATVRCYQLRPEDDLALACISSMRADMRSRRPSVIDKNRSISSALKWVQGSLSMLFMYPLSSGRMS